MSFARSRPIRSIASALAVSTLLLVSCSRSGSDAGGNAASGSSTTSAATALPATVLAAPEDCLTNPFCGVGLREHYGVDVRKGFQPTRPRDVVGKVLDRSALAGVAFSADPAVDRAIADDELVVLADDGEMIGTERVVPVGSTAKLDALGDAFPKTVDRVSAVLTAEDLRALEAGAGDDGAADADLKAWVDEHGPFDEGSGDVVIGAQSFRENQVLAQVYAKALESGGYQVTVKDVAGFRPYLWDAVVFGDVTLGIEYASSAAEYLSGYQGVASTDVSKTMEVLREAAKLRDVEVLDPSPAESRNEFVMRADVAKQLGVTKISDLVKVFPKAAKSAPDEEADLTLGSSPDDPGVGDTGERIVKLEERLIAIGYDPGPADGTFDAETRAAVAKFQTCQGLAPDGVVGPATQDALADPKACVDTKPSTGSGGSSGSSGASGGSGGSGGTPLKPPAEGSVVYLTFDDGPHPTYTPQVLDLLKRFDAKATFFTVGQQVAANPGLVKREVAEGHKVENHTWNHPQLTKVSRDQFFTEVESTSKAITEAGAPKVGCLRPPYGAKNSNVQSWADEAGLKLVLWDVDPQDWDRPGVDAIVSNIVGAAKPGSVILMHDGGGNREQSVAALEQVLTKLKGAGYRFAALPC